MRMLLLLATLARVLHFYAKNEENFLLVQNVLWKYYDSSEYEVLRIHFCLYIIMATLYEI